VDPVTGTVRNAIPVDYEAAKQWHFYVMAQRSGRPGGYHQFTVEPLLVVVDILDENDMAPRFVSGGEELRLVIPAFDGNKIQSQRCNIWNSGDVVGSVLAQDDDSGERLRYSLEHSELDLFDIDPRTGLVTFNSSKGGDDYEAVLKKLLDQPKPTVNLRVSVTDGVHNAQKEFAIELIAASNTMPGDLRFRPLTVSVRENSAAGPRPLSVIWPEYAPIGQQLECSSIGGQNPSPFDLDPASGVLRMRSPVDREQRPQITLAIRCRTTREEKTVQGFAFISINVEDVNDNAPVFDQPFYNLTIGSGAVSPGKQILTFKAADPDAGMNALVRYSLDDDQKVSEFIELDKYDGKLTIRSSTQPSRLEAGSSYEFSIRAIDRGI
jgi:hypothetical protein